MTLLNPIDVGRCRAAVGNLLSRIDHDRGHPAMPVAASHQLRSLELVFFLDEAVVSIDCPATGGGDKILFEADIKELRIIEMLLAYITHQSAYFQKHLPVDELRRLLQRFRVALRASPFTSLLLQRGELLLLLNVLETIDITHDPRLCAFVSEQQVDNVLMVLLQAPWRSSEILPPSASMQCDLSGGDGLLLANCLRLAAIECLENSHRLMVVLAKCGVPHTSAGDFALLQHMILSSCCIAPAGS